MRTHHTRTLAPALVLAASLSLFASPAHPQSLTPLKLFWSNGRSDNFTTATGEESARAAQYDFARVEALIHTAPAPGTIPLKLYWNDRYSDNLTAASPGAISEAMARGYGFSRVEGYIFEDRAPGTIPLKLFYSAERHDYLTVATALGEQSAIDAGYRYVGVEGYVLPADAQPVGVAAGSAVGAVLPPGTAAGRAVGAIAPPPPRTPPRPPHVLRRSGWSNWVRADGVRYRTQSTWYSDSSRFVVAHFEIENLETRPWTGWVRAFDCKGGSSSIGSVDVRGLPARGTRFVEFQTRNCGTADNGWFRPQVGRYYSW